MQTLTSDNSAQEGRIEANPLTFLIRRYLWDPKMRSKFATKLKKFQISLPKVAKVKFGSRVRRPQGLKRYNSQLKLTFSSRVMKKNVIFDPKMTSDLTTVLFENFPLTDSLLVPKHHRCRTSPQEVIASWRIFYFCPYLTLGDLDGQTKTRCTSAAYGLSVDPYMMVVSCTGSEEMRLQAGATHTHTYWHWNQKYNVYTNFSVSLNQNDQTNTNVQLLTSSDISILKCTKNKANFKLW